jgi:hypothetical protein
MLHLLAAPRMLLRHPADGHLSSLPENGCPGAYTHLRRLRSTRIRGRHSRCLWGPAEGLGACTKHPALLSIPPDCGCCARLSHSCTDGLHCSLLLLFAASAAAGRKSWTNAGFPSQPTAPRLSAAHSSMLKDHSIRILTKMPLSLSNIQWDGALSLFMCFLGPRTILPRAP